MSDSGSPTAASQSLERACSANSSPSSKRVKYFPDAVASAAFVAAAVSEEAGVSVNRTRGSHRVTSATIVLTAGSAQTPYEMHNSQKGYVWQSMESID